MPFQFVFLSYTSAYVNAKYRVVFFYQTVTCTTHCGVILYMYDVSIWVEIQQDNFISCLSNKRLLYCQLTKTFSLPVWKMYHKGSVIFQLGSKTVVLASQSGHRGIYHLTLMTFMCLMPCVTIINNVKPETNSLVMSVRLCTYCKQGIYNQILRFTDFNLL